MVVMRLLCSTASGCGTTWLQLLPDLVACPACQASARIQVHAGPFSAGVRARHPAQRERIRLGAFERGKDGRHRVRHRAVLAEQAARHLHQSDQGERCCLLRVVGIT